MRFLPFRSLSRAELLVLLGAVVVLVGVGYVPVTRYLEQSRIARAVESAHTINTLLTQYATDNNGVYPVGEGTPVAGKSEGIARNLLENNYTPDASVFAVGSTPRYAGTASDYADLAPKNLSWDFTAGATATTGLTTATPDDLPTVYGTGETVTYPTTPGAGADLALSGNGPFGSKGIVVAYKGGNAAFMTGVLLGASTTCPGFIPKTLKDPGPYTQIRP